jgi:myxalamid-type polyketide synthase MxaE and MxaD
MGLPALSVNWGAWAEVGLAATTAVTATLAARGFTAMAPDEALELLFRLQATAGLTQVAAMHFDAIAWRAASAVADSPMLAQLERSSPGARPTKSLAAAVLEATAAERPGAVTSYLTAQILDILRSAATSLDPDQSLFALGFDSLMTLSLRTRIQRDLALRLTPLTILEHPSIRTLTGHLQAQLGRSEDVCTEQQVAELSDAEVEAMLRRELSR